MNNKKTLGRFLPALLVLVGLAALSFTVANGVTLKLQPQQGKTYTINTKTNMVSMLEVQGQTMNMSQIMEIRQSFTPLEVNSEQSVIQTQVQAIKMTSSQMGMKLEYDSEHPEKNSPMLAGQTGAFDAMLNKIDTLTYDYLGQRIGEDVATSMGQLGSVIIQLPKKEVNVGSQWTFDKTQNVNDTEISVKMTYTVTAISKKSVDVSIAGTVESSEVTGTYEGTASINPQTGLVMNSSIKQNLSMTINQGISIPMTMIGTTTIELK